MSLKVTHYVDIEGRDFVIQVLEDSSKVRDTIYTDIVIKRNHKFIHFYTTSTHYQIRIYPDGSVAGYFEDYFRVFPTLTSRTLGSYIRDLAKLKNHDTTKIEITRYKESLRK